MATEQSYSPAELMALEMPQPCAYDWPPPNGDFWHDCAPRGVQQRYDRGDTQEAWERWRRYLLTDSVGFRAQRVAEEFAGGRKRAARALTYGLPIALERSPRLNWLLKFTVAGDRRAQRLATEAPQYIDQWFAGWLAASADPRRWQATEAPTLEAIAWARALVRLASVYDGQTWWRLLHRLHDLARGATFRAGGSTADELAYLCIRGELLWTLAAMFPEIQPCRALAPLAAEVLSATIADVLDGDGVPHARQLPVFHRLLASWTRCRLLSAALGSKHDRAKLDACWDDDAEQQYFLAVREALRLLRSDGMPVLTSPGGGAERSKGSVTSLIDLAIGLAPKADKRYRRATGLLAASRELKLRSLKKTHLKKRNAEGVAGSERHLPDAAVHSEWAQLAMLQTDWSRCSNRLTVDYSGPAVRIELQSSHRLLLQGVWEFEIQTNGTSLPQPTSWSEVCWASDADCDYLELEADLTGDVRIQRQMLLSRKDQFLFFADAVLGKSPAALAYRSRLPLVPTVAASPADETRELLLIARRSRAVVLPLELPEWRADPRGGTLVSEEAGSEVAGDADQSASPSASLTTNAAAKRTISQNGSPAQPAGAICLKQEIRGRCLFAPLWIDLSPKRARRHSQNPLTWRQLTVAEQQQIVARDVAVAYRVQSGKRQWVVYRSLAPAANRTFLGVNLSTEFFIGRFQSDGETESVLEIEA